MLQYFDDLKLYFAILFTCIFVYYWKYGRVFYYGSKFDGPFAWPIFGNALAFVGNSQSFHDVISKWMDRYKSPVRMYMGNTLFLFISKPEHLQTILNSPHALGKGDFYYYMKLVMGEGLFTASVQIWKRTRKRMLPVFNLRMLNGFVEVFSRQAEMITKKLGSKVNTGYFNIYPYIYQATFAMICETNLGINLDDQSKGQVYMEAIEELSPIMFRRMISILLRFDVVFKLSSLSKIFNKHKRNIMEFSNNVILERKQFLNNENIDTDYIPRCKTFLNRILELSRKERDIFTDQQILDEVTTIAIAGSETSATTISFVLVMLGMHQDIQENVHKELQDVFQSDDRPVVHKDLAHLHILERVIKETLRLFPIAPILLRKVVQDIDIGTHVLPKDSVCSIVSYHIHRDPELWENPLNFDPDRFLSENVAKRHPYSYLPFSAGPRNCIGLTYAMYSIKSILSTILRKYQVFTSYKSVQEVKLKPDLTTKTAHGHLISLRKRN